MAGKSTFRLLNLKVELAHGMEVANDVGSSFFLLLLEKVVNDAVIETSRPRWVSPAVAKTSKTPSSIESKETSKVPPPSS